MKNFLSILIISLLVAVATWFLPWWMIAVVPFAVVIFCRLRPGRAFLVSAAAIALFWLAVILIRDIPNEHILSSRLAKLFSLPGYGLFIIVNLIVGALVGGLAGWAGGLMNRAFRRR